MKKLFALFCAVVLMPSFSAQAWIGGPFSNNSFFGNEGDDGVYEAVAYPTGGAFSNGVGIFRWGVANTSAFPEGTTISVTSTTIVGGLPVSNVFIVPADPISSNIYFGGYGQVTHSWFVEGVSYRGTCDGMVNSGLNRVSCVGTAEDPNSSDRAISSGFTASFEGSGEGLPLARFSGKGSGRAEDLATGITTEFRFIAFGSKVSSFVSYAGVLDTIN